MSNYKLVAFDLDGTLLNSDMTLAKKTIDNLHRIIDKNIKCAIISGRNLSDILSLINDLDFCYLSSLSGALIYNNSTSEIEYLRSIQKESSIKLIDFLIKNDLITNIFTTNNIYISKYSSLYFSKLYQASLKPKMIDSLNLDENILSIQILLKNDKELDIIKEDIKNKFNNLEIFNAGYSCLQINQKEANKGAALKFIADKLNIQLTQTIAVGDSEMDLPMLNIAGMGIGMKNSKNHLLDKVKFITKKDNNNNGATNFILNILENNYD
ncbi:MAG: hypothetical protein A2086_12835 [Spirochaetes bacterium GWD1_27_9]|nr:MAG: hypothetical protein A2Z98_00640 [Spirochaetes bacterium GWB1_27_13]OHD24753.1 MAG: hypothetical protein A2Y34_08385 [Spirochaetes bacterium GWC1_27_15]OHD43961.1 MAG: hypothetical protein A2086_12835 [Spirochaetes bacterium GWD1_27_9]